MSMPDLWSPDALAPRPMRRLPAPPAIVPRCRIEGKREPTAAEKLEARRRRERDQLVADAWTAGFRAAEAAFGTRITYGDADALPTRITMNRILEEVAEKHGVTVRDIKSDRRRRALVVARQEAMWRAYNETSHSLPTVGKLMGGKDHATVLHGIRRHEERLAREAEGK